MNARFFVRLQNNSRLPCWTAEECIRTSFRHQGSALEGPPAELRRAFDAIVTANPFPRT